MNADATQILIQALTGLFYAIPTLLFIGISTRYLLKKGSNTDGTLVLIGNIILLLPIVIGKILFILYQKWDSTTYIYLVSAINIISFIGSILFVIRLFLLTKKVIKINNS